MTHDRGRSTAVSIDRMRDLAHVWDDLIRIPVLGRRIGLDAILGLVPGLGDATGGLVAAYGLVIATRLGVSPPVILRMMLNIGVDTIVGAVPVLGDLFDIGWKANSRNLALVERAIAEPGRVRRSSIIALGAALFGVVGLLAFVVWLVVAAFRAVYPG